MNKDIKSPKSYSTGKIGELSVNLIFQKNNIICTPLGTSDFGEDLLCDIFSKNEDCEASIRTQLSFRTQIKTTSEITKEGYIRQTTKGFTISIATNLLKLWSQSFYPVVLIIWDCSTNKGYWCFPTDQINNISKLEKGTISIFIDPNNTFDDNGVQKIKDQVECYYNNIYKINNAQYKCTIYPVWMPKYRLFTITEVITIIPQNNTKIEHSYHSADILPAFLSSYNNCNLGNFISGFEYSDTAQPLNQFWDGLTNFINSLSLTPLPNEWISFIISPVEIISKLDNRRISNLTDWTCLSLINNNIVTDFNYNFELSPNYIYSQKVRATSSEQNLFIHNSGEYAVEILVAGFAFSTRREDSKLISTIQNKSFCVVDISKCTPAEITAITNWCQENNYQFIRLSQDPNKIIISHQHFFAGDFGVITPGTATWNEWDALNFDTKTFLDTIPYGCPQSQKEKERIAKKYFQQQNITSDLYLLSYSQALYSEALCHSDRIIRLITYIEKIDIAKYQKHFSQTKSNLKKLFNKFKLYHEEYENILEITLEITPLPTQSTKQVLTKVENIYYNLITILKQANPSQKNMAYYTKYQLDRWIPEHLIKNK